jgi:hypothetical protein
MSNQDAVRDLLDVVVRDDASAVRFDPARAWREGRRRRIVDGLGVIAAVVVLIGVGLALTSFVFGMTPPLSPASGSGEVATKHPQRLDYIYWDDDQPRVTGPLAGVVQRNGGGVSGWYTVSPEGHLWRLDLDPATGIGPSLSPDGSHLGYMPGALLDADYVIANQLDGTKVVFPQIGTGAYNADGSATHTYFHSAQSPAFWSPNGDELLLRISRTGRIPPGPDPAAAVLGTDGSFTAIPALPGSGRNGAHPVGWIDEDHVALVAGLDSIKRVRFWVVDVRTGDVARTFLLEQRDSRYGFVSQWFGRLSPDGNELATPVTSSGSEIASVQLYSMRSDPPGELSATVPAVPSATDSCSPSWTSSDLYLPTTSMDDDAGDGAAILVRADVEATIVADSRLNIVCSTWSRTALEGDAHQTWGSRFFGADDNWLSWHWREVSLSSVLGLGLLVVALLAKRRSWRLRTRR